ncbi:MAG: outer membrane beta-barrel protein [Paludibacter sp.]|nr:outer membrane beta-barrel protein [Paludibacter sp.]
MKRSQLLSIALLVTVLSFGQTLKIQSGVSISNIYIQTSGASDNLTQDNKRLVGYSFSVGLDYLQHKNFNLSSNIGMLRKGGQALLYSTWGYGQGIKATLDYLSLNTTCDFQFPIEDKITPYISFGPRVDVLLNPISEYSSFNYGLLLGGGLKYPLSDKLQLGLRADYYLNLRDISKTGQARTVSDKTFTTNLVLGYRL